MARAPKVFAFIAVSLVFAAGAFLLVPFYRPLPLPPRPVAAPPLAIHDCSLDRYNPVRISDWFTADNVVNSKKPLYPKDVHARGISGQVLVQVLINLRTGRVEKACAYAGPPELWMESERAATQWQFRTPPFGGTNLYARDFLIFDYVKAR